jgi:uncharacterized damage-inducible protein DinB
MSVSQSFHLIRELERGHGLNPWHGPSRKEVLADVTYEEAARSPGPGVHSIWELVLHMRAWTQEVARRVREGNWSEPAAGDFPAVGATTKDAWHEAVNSLDVAHDELRSAVKALPDERLDDVVKGASGGSGDSLRETIHGLAQHDAYHTGQIQILKKLYRAKS